MLIKNSVRYHFLYLSTAAPQWIPPFSHDLPKQMRFTTRVLRLSGRSNAKPKQNSFFRGLTSILYFLSRWWFIDWVCHVQNWLIISSTCPNSTSFSSCPRTAPDWRIEYLHTSPPTTATSSPAANVNGDWWWWCIALDTLKNDHRR